MTSPGWQVTTQFVLAGNEEIADYNGTGAGAPLMMTVRGVGGLPVAAVTPAEYGNSLTAVYYHHDVMGSTVAVTQGGSSGASEAYTYSDFGAPGAGSWATYRYAGYRYDNETGLYYVNARYYNPNLGRFLQTDPIGLSGGTNLYAYVGNDPINLFDPTGLACQVQNQGSQVPPEARAAIMDSVSASNAPSAIASDKVGGFHEEGGYWGKDISGNVVVIPAVPGKFADPSVVSKASIDIFNVADPSLAAKLVSIDGGWHVHPSGSVTVGDKLSQFIQPPSQADINNGNLPINIAVGARDSKVYFYNSSGQIGKPVKLNDLGGR